ncbi:alkylation response protein AidB-like acyl-CoA dehydrogenase [Branchiibius hedensis]|uniref:Acyl-CoA dehydrogenase, N-terminal domain n=1 Tax=Branchiibius hedensis TaxID=672460 RepID=A0A2Y8ZV77_9MICO|nr:acyl-CoA dehydrogenase [Branchiibius hedensis]PWJ27034.1 alkylation response protein AidB-like acyl-CoA dehydrogenase [Branchiibius hedensis]SSA35845.1 Acyl-CoA dehydrogenase, N-terminal domain [Branchiibius hedensis]
MRFALTEDQTALQQVVRAVMAQQCPPDLLRDVAATGPAAADGLRSACDEMGIWGLLVPEEDGGLGLDETALVAVLAETGAAAAPLPLVGTLAVAPGVLAELDRCAQLASGEVLCAATPQLTGPAPSRGADLLIRGGFGGRGALSVFDLTTADRSATEAIDPASLLEDVSGATLLATIDDPDIVRRAWLRGVLGTAAELVGVARRMLGITVAYVTDRQQFGAPIGSFQAVKHHLADAALATEFAAPLVLSAAAQVAAGAPGAQREVHAAKAAASDAARTTARQAIQCHGAMGYTTEYDLQLYAKRAWADAASWGTAQWHREALATDLGVPAS